MDLLQKLQEDMKAAMKSGDKSRLGVIRMLISDVKIIDMAPKPTTAEDAVAAYAKKLRKSAEEYQKLGKPDEVEKLKYELGIVDSYLPRKASAEETERLVDEFLKTQSFTAKQAGQAMGAFMKAHGSAIDPALANAAVRKKLGGGGEMSAER
ncbi:MAG TPA: GatB/YqeY domain-containing protein [Tepidisphaeraceae bacterium]|nr:GatB/YqeY domain-containing protein [Tepidisphaeraceae bacterium]